MLIDMCGTEEASPRNIQPVSPHRTPCTECTDIESLPILELSAEAERMLSRAVAEKRYQSGASPREFVLEHL